MAGSAKHPFANRPRPCHRCSAMRNKLTNVVVGCSLAFLLVGCALSRSARVVKDYPDLKPADGSKSKIEWSKADQFDYLVFNGHLREDPSAGVGIYVGGSPDFRPPPNAVTIKGKLGVFDVEWYPLQAKGKKFYRTCLINYQKATVHRGQRESVYWTMRHIWVFANTEAGLDAMIAELDKLQMFSAKPADLVM